MCPGFLHEALALTHSDWSCGRERPGGAGALGPQRSFPGSFLSFCPSSLHTFLPSGVPPCPLSTAPLPLFLGQELLICNSIGAKCFAKLLKQLKATGWREKHYKHFTNNYMPALLREPPRLLCVCVCERERERERDRETERQRKRGKEDRVRGEEGRRKGSLCVPPSPSC